MTVYTTSSIPSVKATLVSRLQARAGLAGVQVAYGWPKGAIQKELVLVGGTKGAQAWGPFGKRSKDEEYDLQVAVSVVFADGVQQAATERAFVIVGEIEQELRNDPTVGGIVRLAAVEGNFSLDENVLGGLEREAFVEFSVHVDARI